MSNELGGFTRLYNETEPPHSKTSPDFTSFTASSADAHTFDFFGTGMSVGVLYVLIAVANTVETRRGRVEHLYTEMNIVAQDKSPSLAGG